MSHDPCTVNHMTTTPITKDQIREQIEQVVSPHGLTVEEFLAFDLDEIDDDELRDLWLMVTGTLA